MGIGFSIGRLWFSLFDWSDFFGIWFSFGYQKSDNCLAFEFQLFWLQFVIGWDFDDR